MILSEHIQIISILTGDRLYQTYWSTKLSSTILTEQDSKTLSRTDFNWRCPPAANLTPWRISSICMHPQWLHLLKTRIHLSSRDHSRTHSMWTGPGKMVYKATTHISPCRLISLVVYQANLDWTNTVDLMVKYNHQHNHQHHRSQLMSLKADNPPANGYDADIQTAKLASALNTYKGVTQCNSRITN